MDLIFIIYLESVFWWLVSDAGPGASQLVTNYLGPGVNPRVTTSLIRTPGRCHTEQLQPNKLGEKDFIFNTECQIKGSKWIKHMDNLEISVAVFLFSIQAHAWDQNRMIWYLFDCEIELFVRMADKLSVWCSDIFHPVHILTLSLDTI